MTKIWNSILKPDYNAESLDVREQKKNAWMATFCDLLSLLLTFFILLYAMSDPSKGKWREVTESFMYKFQPDKINRLPPLRSLDVDYFYKVLKRRMQMSPEFNSQIILQKFPDKVIVSIPHSSIFDKDDKLKLSINSISLLYFVGSAFFDLKNEVTVHSISDLNQTYTYEDTQNPLSFAQAGIIADELKEISLINKIKAFSRNTYYVQISPDEDGRDISKFSNRIDIVVNDETNED